MLNLLWQQKIYEKALASITAQIETETYPDLIESAGRIIVLVNGHAYLTTIEDLDANVYGG